MAGVYFYLDYSYNKVGGRRFGKRESKHAKIEGLFHQYVSAYAVAQKAVSLVPQ